MTLKQIKSRMKKIVGLLHTLYQDLYQGGKTRFYTCANRFMLFSMLYGRYRICCDRVAGLRINV